MHPEAELQSLKELLDGVDLMPDAMRLGELDGFVAGLLLSPELIMLDEWLPAVWGMDNEPKFKSMEQAQDTTEAVMAHYNRVAESLARRTHPYEIVLEQVGVDDKPFWEFWIAGFEQAMQLRPESWQVYQCADDEQVKAAFLVICSLLEIEHFESSLPFRKQEALQEHACDLIPEMVMVMNDWIKSQNLAALNGSVN